MATNIAEKNLLEFTFTLLIGDVTVFVLSLTRWRISGESCKVLAVLLHFFVLSLMIFVICFSLEALH